MPFHAEANESNAQPQGTRDDDDIGDKSKRRKVARFLIRQPSIRRSPDLMSSSTFKGHATYVGSGKSGVMPLRNQATPSAGIARSTSLVRMKTLLAAALKLLYELYLHASTDCTFLQDAKKRSPPKA